MTGDAAPAPDIEDEHLAAQAGAALFGTRPVEFAGRYRLLKRLGRGGMGVVFAAVDAQLGRKVALKIVQKRVDRFSHVRALREAEMLAKLTHANVVAVYDAGSHEGRIWIAMEFVDGVTLRTWHAQRRRCWSEVLPVLVDAARGLAAVHRVNVVHSDLKPDNIMIDCEGRVRVLDFGLAHAHRLAEVDEASETAAAPIGGTPAYMAPEQAAGGEFGAAADQYAWCMLALELLCDEQPGRVGSAVSRRTLPRWLRRVLERGLERAPGRRWSSMEALMAALEQGAAQARRRRVLAFAAGVAGVLAVALGVRAWQAAEAEAACVAEGAAIDAVWDGAARERLEAALTEAGPPETAARVLPLLDRHAEAWRATRTAVCRAARTGDERGEDLQERARWCLDERMYELETLVAELSRSDTRVATFALPAAAGLAPLAACRDEVLLARLAVPPPDRRDVVRSIRAELVQVRALDGSGQYRESLVRMEQADAAASVLAWPPLLATTRLQLGLARERVGDYDAAVSALQEAFHRSMDVRMPELTVDAGAALVRVLGHRLVRTKDARDWVVSTARAAAAVEPEAGLRTAALLRSEAQLERAVGELDTAERLLGHAWAIEEQRLGAGHPSLAETLNDLGNVLFARGELEKARVIHVRVLTLREQAFGPENPLIAASLNNLAMVYASLGDFAEAMRLFERARSIEREALAAGHPEAAKTLKNLANLLVLADGDNTEAQQLYEQVRAIEEKTLGPEHPDVAATLHGLGYVHERRGELKQARGLYEDALTIQRRVFETPHPDVGITLSSLAALHATAGEHREAGRLYEQVLAIQEHVLGSDHVALAGTLFELANAQWEAGEQAVAQATIRRALEIQADGQGEAPPLDERAEDIRERVAADAGAPTTGPRRRRSSG